MRFLFSCPKGAGKKSLREGQCLRGTNPGEKAILKISEGSQLLFWAVGNRIWFYGHNSHTDIGWSIGKVYRELIQQLCWLFRLELFGFPLRTSGREFQHCLKSSQSHFWNLNLVWAMGRYFCRASVLTWRVLNSVWAWSKIHRNQS